MSNVTVTSAFGSSATGRFTLIAQGSLMDSSDVAIVTPVLVGVLVAGQLTASVLASDSAGFADGALNWHVLVEVQGLANIDVENVPINFSNGASQNLLTVLTAAGWTPTTT